MNKKQIGLTECIQMRSVVLEDKKALSSKFLHYGMISGGCCLIGETLSFLDIGARCHES